MTDRISGFIITLERDIREDDVQDTLNAIRAIRGVVSVKPQVSDTQTLIAHERANNEWRMRLGALITPSKEQR